MRQLNLGDVKETKPKLRRHLYGLETNKQEND